MCIIHMIHTGMCSYASTYVILYRYNNIIEILFVCMHVPINGIWLPQMTEVFLAYVHGRKHAHLNLSMNDSHQFANHCMLGKPTNAQIQLILT